eukprot:2360811-Pleurochrysis_carterae.AAC.1
MFLVSCWMCRGMLWRWVRAISSKQGVTGWSTDDPIVLEQLANFELLKVSICGHGALKLFKGSARRRGDAVAVLVPPARAEPRMRLDMMKTFAISCNFAVFLRRCLRRHDNDRSALPAGKVSGFVGDSELSLELLKQKAMEQLKGLSRRQA